LFIQYYGNIAFTLNDLQKDNKVDKFGHFFKKKQMNEKRNLFKIQTVNPSKKALARIERFNSVKSKIAERKKTVKRSTLKKKQIIKL